MAFPLSAPNMYIHICIVISYVISSPAEAKATGPASSAMLYVVFGSPIVTFITTCQFICSLRISMCKKRSKRYILSFFSLDKPMLCCMIFMIFDIEREK